VSERDSEEEKERRRRDRIEEKTSCVFVRLL
jgi:hypothetical protein